MNERWKGKKKKQKRSKKWERLKGASLGKENDNEGRKYNLNTKEGKWWKKEITGEKLCRITEEEKKKRKSRNKVKKKK